MCQKLNALWPMTVCVQSTENNDLSLDLSACNGMYGVKK